jgi:bacillithiol system protein YtxJ
VQITERSALDRALDADLFLLFKHSRRCPVSAWAFREYEAFLGERRDLQSGWIDVIENRALSDEVASRTQLPHASPQALVLRRGSVAWSATHGAITGEALAGAVQ